MALWSVFYAVAEAYVDAVDAAAADVLEPVRHAIMTEVVEGGEERATQLALNVDAGSLSGAISVSEGQWARVQAAAGVPKTAAHLDFVVGPMDEPAPFHDQLLMRARQLVGTGEPTYALVAAVSAYEVYERQAVRDIAARDMPDELAESVWALYKRANRTQQEHFLQNLLGNKLEEAGQPWTEYKASLRSRQGIVHGGAVVDDATATTAVTAIGDLISWIERVCANALKGRSRSRQQPDAAGLHAERVTTSDEAACPRDRQQQLRLRPAVGIRSDPCRSAGRQLLLLSNRLPPIALFMH